MKVQIENNAYICNAHFIIRLRKIDLGSGKQAQARSKQEFNYTLSSALVYLTFYLNTNDQIQSHAADSGRIPKCGNKLPIHRTDNTLFAQSHWFSK